MTRATKEQRLAYAGTELFSFLFVLAGLAVGGFVAGALAGLYRPMTKGALSVGISFVLLVAAAIGAVTSRRWEPDVREPSEAPTPVLIEDRVRTATRVAVAALAAIIVSGVACLVIALLVVGVIDSRTAAEPVLRAAALLEITWLALFSGRLAGFLVGLRRHEQKRGVALLTKPLATGQRSATYVAAGPPSTSISL